MVRSVKKSPEQCKGEILSAAQTLFISKGYEKTLITFIMEILTKMGLPLLNSELMTLAEKHLTDISSKS